MIEKKVLQYINQNSEIPCYMEEPINPPKKYYLMEKTGAGQNDRLFNVTLAIQSYGETMLEAAELNDQIISLMLNANIPNVTRIRLNSDYNYTDITTKRYRYQAVFYCIFYREDY